MKNIFLTLIAVAILTSCGAPTAASEAAPVASTFPTPGMLMNTPAMTYFFPGKMRI